jgi:hypothetical protein
MRRAQRQVVSVSVLFDCTFVAHRHWEGETAKSRHSGRCDAALYVACWHGGVREPLRLLCGDPVGACTLPLRCWAGVTYPSRSRREVAHGPCWSGCREERSAGSSSPSVGLSATSRRATVVGGGRTRVLNELMRLRACASAEARGRDDWVRDGVVPDRRSTIATNDRSSAS